MSSTSTRHPTRRTSFRFLNIWTKRQLSHFASTNPLYRCRFPFSRRKSACRCRTETVLADVRAGLRRRREFFSVARNWFERRAPDSPLFVFSLLFVAQIGRNACGCPFIRL